MSGEIKTSDSQEIRNPNLENYKEIKPQSDISYVGAKDYWNNTFKTSEGGDSDSQTEYIGSELQEYRDDNGHLYRQGIDLLPNNEYTINDYHYKTDDQGRIVEASGKLHLRNREGRLEIKDSKKDIGKGDEKETDDRGHLIADRFDGSNGLENMVPQDGKINKGDFNQFESQLAEKVGSGCDVRVKVEPIYEGDSHRPDVIAVSYSIDGKQGTRVFPNP